MQLLLNRQIKSSGQQQNNWIGLEGLGGRLSKTLSNLLEKC